MEVSTVSPPPASPTEGDDLCEMDVTNVAIDSVTLLICLCGLAGNGAVLWLLGFRIHRKPILILAFLDSAFLLFVVPSPVLYLLEEASCSAVMPLTYQRLLFPVSALPYFGGLYLLTALSINRCMSILCPLRCCCHYALSPLVLVCPLSIMTTEYFLCQSQNTEQCGVASTCMYALNAFLFSPAMVISSTILFIKAKCGSQQREHKRLDIVVSLTVFVFVPLTFPLSLGNFLQHFGYTPLSSQVVFLLTCIHSTIKPLIYFLVGSWRRDCSLRTCWKHFSMKSLREALQRVFEETEDNTAHSDDAAMDIVL